jgi:predicted amidophosphoribosyltransferase
LEGGDIITNTYERRKKQGLCVSCGKALPENYNFVLCVACRKKNRENNKLRRQKLRNSGLCVICGKETENGYLTCELCRADVAEDYRNRVQRRIEKKSLPGLWRGKRKR